MGVDVAVEFLARHVDAAGAETGDAAHLRVDHRLHKGRSNGRIHDIATAFKSLKTDLNRLRLWCGYHAICQRTTPFKLKLFCGRILSLERRP